MSPPQARESTGQRVKAVRIACEGECTAGIEEWNELDIPSDHEVFSAGEVLSMSKIIGIQILVSRIRPSMVFAATRDSFGYTLSTEHYKNAMAEKLMICCDASLAREDSENATLFETPQRWLRNVGNVILARADHKPLYYHHLKVLHDFMHPMLASNLWNPELAATTIRNDSARPQSDARVLAEVTPRDFKDFYLERIRVWKAETEDSARLVELPTPWSWSATTRISLRRNQIRKAYSKMSVLERFQRTENWKEKILLKEMYKLQCRLGEAAGTVGDPKPVGESSRIGEID